MLRPFRAEAKKRSICVVSSAKIGGATDELTAALVNAVKELSATVKSLQTKVDKLEKNVTKG